MRILSGIQPSGALHIGNYLGAIQQYIALQHGNEAFYFVADYHALTSVREADRLRGYVKDVLLDLLALGLWGVPCFHIDGVATWGQDRLWQVRDALRAREAA